MLIETSDMSRGLPSRKAVTHIYPGRFLHVATISVHMHLVKPFEAADLAGEDSLTVLEVRALSDLDNISVRIADIAARLAVLGDRLRDELRSATFP